MLQKQNERLLARLLYFGVPAITLVVGNMINYDPVNITKMFLLSVIGFAVFGIVISTQYKTLVAENKLTAIFLSLFIFAAVSSSIFSELPFTQNLFGVFGRNTGLLTYIALAGILIGTLTFRNKIYFRRMVYGLLFAGLGNLILNALAMVGIDVISWNNIYNTLLGTFGNPNFISSFLGIFFSTLLAYMFGSNIPLRYKFLSIPIFALTFFQVIITKSIQGVVVIALGIAVVGFFLVKYYIKKLWIQISYLLAAATAAIFAVAGALQMGPLTDYIYKTSVSLRGEYWQAGITMGLDHPLTGVGMDGYGDWFRRARDESAMILPGPNTVTNSAHNVNLDIFAYGGFPLLLSYLALIIIAAIAILKVARRQENYDPIFVSLSVAWICYQAQALISINQIGLAVWGWALTGLVIAYEFNTRPNAIYEFSIAEKNKTTIKSKTKNDFSESKSWFAGILGASLGFSLAIMPFVADSNWRSSLGSGSLPTVQAAAQKNPTDAYRLVNIAILFEQNGFTAQAADLIRKAVEYNPDYFDAWRVMSGMAESTISEKSTAKANLIRLDPLNPEWKNLQ